MLEATVYRVSFPVFDAEAPYYLYFEVLKCLTRNVD